MPLKRHDQLSPAQVPQFKPETSYPTPNKADRFVIEKVAIKPSKYRPLPYHSPHPDYDRNGLILVWQGKVKSENNQTIVTRVYSNDLSNDDWYNASYRYSGDVNETPIFIRSYIELREDYEPLAKRSLLPTLIRLKVTAEGAGYTSRPTVVFSAGAGAATAIMNPAGTKVIGLELTNPGSYTTAPTISFTGGGGSGAAATAFIQPAGAVLVKEETTKLDADDAQMASLFIKVTRIYEFLPGPFLPYTRYDADLGPVRGKRRAVLTTPTQVTVNSATQQTRYESREGSAIVSYEIFESWTDGVNDLPFPEKDTHIYVDVRGSVNRNSHLVVKDGTEVGSFTRSNGVVTKTDYEPYQENEFLLRKVVEQWTEVIIDDREVTTIHGGGILQVTETTDEPGVQEVETGQFVVESVLRTKSPHEQTKITKKLLNTQEPYLQLTDPGHDYVTPPVVLFGAGDSGSGAAGTVVLAATPSAPPGGGDPGGVFNMNFSALGDGNGLFTFIGARYNGGTWRNPATAGDIQIVAVGDPSFPPTPSELAALVDHQATPRVTVVPQSGGGHSITFALQPGRSFKPNRITLRQTSDAVGGINKQHYLQVQGTNDNGATWTDLGGGVAIPQTPGEWSTSGLPNLVGYNAFRIFGLDDDHPQLILTEVEFYGELTIVPGLALTYGFDGDDHGVFNYLGVLGGGGTWRNPQTFGDIECAADALVLGTLDQLVDRAPSNITQDGTVGRSYYFDLKPGRMLVCNKMSVRQRTGSNTTLAFNLQGDSDPDGAGNWHDLAVYSQAASSDAWHSKDVAGSTGYRKFRIISAAGLFDVGEVELYGQLTFPSAPPAATFEVDHVDITDGGSGYPVAPSVIIGSVDSGGGSGAAGVAEITGGVVTRVRITDRGTGYLTAPDIAFSGGTGAGATADAVISGSVVAINVTSDGATPGYPTAPDVDLIGDGTGATAHSVVGKGVDSITVDDPGSGYSVPPLVDITGGSGVDATAHAILDAGVSAIVVSAGGTGYLTPPDVIVTGDGTGATAEANLTAVPGDTTTYAYSSPGDMLGAFFGIGTTFGTLPWANPHTAGRVTFFETSNLSGNTPADYCDRVGQYHTTDNGVAPGVTAEYVGVDLGAGRSMVVTSYLLRNGAGDGLNAPSNWKLRGSNDVAFPYNKAAYDAATWTDIDNRVNDTTIAQTVDAWGYFDGYSTPADFRFFQILATGFNRTGALYFIQIGEIEFYGDLTYPSEPGFVSSIDVLTPGSGYTTAPDVIIGSVDDGGGTGAAADAEISGGVGSIVVDDAGEDYETPPTVGFDSGTAAATAVLATNGRIKSVVIDTAGTGYTAAPTVDFDGGTAAATASIAGPVDHFVVTAPGAGYGTAPDVMIAGDGTGAAAHAVVAGGIVTDVILDAGGTGYTLAPGVALVASGGPIGQAILGFAVDSVDVTAPGADFVNPPAVDFQGDGSGAQGYAVLGYAVSGVTMNSRGHDYTGNPAVIFQGGNPTTIATGTAKRRFAVASVNVTNGGSSYETPPAVIVNPFSSIEPDGQIASFEAVIGRPILLQLLGGGAGYADVPDVDFSAPLTNETAATATAVLGYKLLSIALTNGGTGYTTPPIVDLSDGDPGVVATATAVLTADVVTAINIVTFGEDYETTPTIAFSGGGGTGAAATATLETLGRVKRLELASGGVYGTAPSVFLTAVTDPTTAAVAVATLDAATAGPMVRVDILNAGSGYQSAPSLSFPGGGGTGAAATPVLSTQGQIFGVTITGGGAGYTSPPVVLFGAGGGPGAGAFGLGIRSATGKVRAVVLTSQGLDYTEPPEVSFIGGAGSGATAEANLETAGRIKELLLIFPGPMYSVAPLVSFSGGGGADAAALYILGTGWPILHDIITDPVEAFRVLVTKQVVAEDAIPPDEVYVDQRGLDKWRAIQMVSKLDLTRIPPPEEFEQSYHFALPDTLLSVAPFYSRETQNDTRFQYEYIQSNVSARVIGHIALATRRGFNGAVIAKAVRRFFVGPPPIGMIPPPTHIQPSKGTITLVSQVRGHSKEYGRHGSGSRAFVDQKLHNYDAVEIGDIGNVLTGGLIQNYSSGALNVTGANIYSFAAWLEASLAASGFFAFVQPTIIAFDPPTVSAVANLSFNLPASCPQVILPGSTLLVAVNVEKLRFNLFCQTTIYATVPSGCVEPEPPDYT